MQWWGGHPGQGPLQPPFLVPPTNFYLAYSSPTFLEHLEQVLCEMFSFLCLIYALKTWCRFDVLGGGPLTLLLASGKVTKEDVEAKDEGNTKPESERSPPRCDTGPGASGTRESRSLSSGSRGKERTRTVSDSGSNRNPSSHSEEEEDAARSAFVSSWSGDEENGSSAGSQEGGELEDETKGCGSKEEKVVEEDAEDEVAEECDPSFQEEASSSDSSDSNITSELSDDQTFDDSVCDDEGVEGEEVGSSAVNDVENITNTPWYSEWASRLVLRYFSVREGASVIWQ